MIAMDLKIIWKVPDEIRLGELHKLKSDSTELFNSLG
tara:strand:+ start:3081 stop:3191 length:111 start_codon:yes stop_codon:yes gene_type:complete